MVDFWKLMQNGRIFIYQYLLTNWTIFRIMIFEIAMFGQM
jgi:hypothetical protein